MVQFYFLMEFFLLFSCGLLLSEKFGSSLLFLINLRDYFSSFRGLRIAYLISGLVSVFAGSLSPVEPGPMVIGDIVPVITVLLNMIHFLSHEITEPLYKKRTKLGMFTLVVAILHLVFPSFVLL